VETINPIAHDFILFCIRRHGKEWPALYDEMCWVAGQRLFRGLGCAELRELGLSFSFTSIEDITRMVDIVASEEQEAYSGR